MASCSTVTAPSSVITSYSTSTITAQQVSTVPGSTSTISSQVFITSCATPAGTNGSVSAVCSTSTSFTLIPTVLPGATTTVYSTGETVLPVYSTSYGAVSTVCDAVSTTSSSSSSPSSTSQDATTQSTATSDSSAAAAGPSSSITYITTTSTVIPTASTSTQVVESTTTLPTDSLAAAVSSSASSSRSSQTSMVQSTSFLTVYVTTVDASGHTTTYASSVPTLLNVPKNNSSSSTAGAIAGGVVGGVAALVLALLALWLMKKRGCFGRSDEKFEEDVWAPPPHGEYYGSMAARNRTATGGTLVGDSGPGGSAEGQVDEKEREIDGSPMQGSPQWGPSLGPQAYPEAAEAIGAAALGRAYSGIWRSPSNGAGPTRSISNRLSVHSGAGASSQGHSDGYSPASYNQPLPPVPDRRLSQISGYGYLQNYAPPHPEIYAEELGAYRSHSPPQRARSVSPTFPAGYESAIQQHAPVSRRTSTQGLALPLRLRTESYGARSSLARPSLEVIQSSAKADSGTPLSDTSRGQTSDSISTISTSPLSSNPLLHSNSYGSATTAATSLNPHLSSPQVDRLKLQRPNMDRTVSSDSFIVPQQWLGARIANADAESASESGMESKEDLALAPSRLGETSVAAS
ncbi:hypothetical protein JCM5296_005402 [Sporobolomyces johnsonii]